MTAITSGHYVQRAYTGLFTPTVQSTNSSKKPDGGMNSAPSTETGSLGPNAPVPPQLSGAYPSNLSYGTQSTLLAAQEATTGDTRTDGRESTGYEPSDIEKQFQEYMDKTPAERIRDAILKELGITEEDLASMPPEQREAMEQEIAQRIQDMAVQNAEDKEKRDA